MAWLMAILRAATHVCSLCGLLDDARVDGIFASLLGDDYVYLGSDGNFYVGDTRWHSDSDWSVTNRPTRALT